MSRDMKTKQYKTRKIKTEKHNETSQNMQPNSPTHKTMKKYVVFFFFSEINTGMLIFIIENSIIFFILNVPLFILFIKGISSICLMFMSGKHVHSDASL